MDIALTMENLYHEIMLRECKGEEEQLWENSRHEIMAKSITESCNYYGSRNSNKEQTLER